MIDYETCSEKCGQDKGDGRYRGRGPKKLYGKVKVSLTAQGCVSARFKVRHRYINKIKTIHIETALQTPKVRLMVHCRTKQNANGDSRKSVGEID